MLQSVLTLPFRPTPFSPAIRHFSGCEILEPALILAVHVLREVDFPTNAVVHGQLGSDTPRVLNVREKPILPFSRIGRIADVPREGIAPALAAERQARDRRRWDQQWWSGRTSTDRSGESRSEREGLLRSGDPRQI